jgi:hypothetical protein
MGADIGNLRLLGSHDLIIDGLFLFTHAEQQPGGSAPLSWGQQPSNIQPLEPSQVRGISCYGALAALPHVKLPELVSYVHYPHIGVFTAVRYVQLLAPSLYC